jgi:hypothetical protein
MNIRKSEGKYSLVLMQKMATVAATADGLAIEGNNFKVGALIGCPDMVLFACERIAELQKELTAAKALIVKMSGNVIDMDNCEEASDEMDEFWTRLKELSLTNLGRTDS